MNTLEEIVSKVECEYRSRAENTLSYLEKEKQATIENIKRHHGLLPRLQEVVGDNLRLWEGARLDSLDVHLGELPRAKRAKEQFYNKLLAIKRLVGNLKVVYKDIHNARKKQVYVVLASAEYPEVKIKFVTKLPEDAKCKIQKRVHKQYVSHDLVCRS